MNVMPSQLIPQLTQELDRLHQQKATGELVLTHRNIAVTIYLLSGRLLYVADAEHRVRRWQRSLHQHCHDWDTSNQSVNSQPWEYELLYQGLSKKHLVLEQAKAVISTVAQECWSELVLAKDITLEWNFSERAKSAFSYFLSLSLAEIHPALTQASEIYEEWHNAKLDNLRPSLAPSLTPKATSVNNPTLQRFLNGQYTIWDIALHLKQPVTKVMRSLVPWQDKELIVFKEIPDLAPQVKEIRIASPNAAKPETPIANVSESIPRNGLQKALIACIDDSPIVVHNLKKILNSVGYEVLSIQEPMAGFAKLIEHKPDLILLDLNMPNANGYSVCKFLRESPVFNKTPIIILTAQDTIIDRTRAKIVGANDFISKPCVPEELIKIINSYLPKSQDVLESSSGYSQAVPQAT